MNKKIKKMPKFTKVQLSTVICLIGVFVTGTVLRYGIYDIDYLQKYSPLMILGFVLVCSYSRGKSKDISYKRFDRKILPEYILLVCYCFILSFLQEEVRAYLQINVFIATSVIIALFRFRDSGEYIGILKIWVSFLRLCVIIMICGELIDVLQNMAMTRFIADFSGLASLTRMYQKGRSVTYMGHSLFSAEIYLIYYCFEYILCKIEKTKQRKWSLIISLIGVALTQARSTFVLLLLLIMILNMQTGKIKNIILFLLSVVIIYKLGFLNGILDRIAFGIANGDISSGRNTSIQLLLSTGKLDIRWFSGHIGYDETATLLNMSLEYPILAWAYCYGIFGAIIFVVILFLYPLVKAFIRKQRELLVIEVVIMLCVNSFAGLSTCGIQPFVYYITLCMLINTSNYLKVKQKIRICKEKKCEKKDYSIIL